MGAPRVSRCSSPPHTWHFNLHLLVPESQMLILCPLPGAKTLLHFLLTNGEQQGVEPSDDPLYTQLCCSLNILLHRMPRGRGWAHLLTLCPQVPGAPTDACCYLFQALSTIKGMLGQGKGEDEAAWFGGAKFGRVLCAMKLELQT